MQPSTYLKMIAGTLPEHGQGAVDDSLRILAQEALGVSQIHYLRSPHPVSGLYHYFAIPSAVLASEPSPITELAIALPGHPGHRGPAAYVLDAGVYKIAALFDGTQLDIVCNEAELVADLLSEQSLPLVKVGPEVEAWRFQSSYTKRTQMVESLTARISKFSLALLVFSGVALAGLQAADGWLSAKMGADNEASAKALAEALASMQVGSPLAKQLADYQQRSSVAVRSGGWVDAYKLKEGKESYRLFVPAWVTPDYVQSLGTGVAADRDPKDEQLLILVKGDPVGGKEVTSAETVARQATPEEEAAAADAAGAPAADGAPVPPPPAMNAAPAAH